MSHQDQASSSSFMVSHHQASSSPASSLKPLQETQFMSKYNPPQDQNSSFGPIQHPKKSFLNRPHTPPPQPHSSYQFPTPSQPSRDQHRQAPIGHPPNPISEPLSKIVPQAPPLSRSLDGILEEETNSSQPAPLPIYSSLNQASQGLQFQDESDEYVAGHRFMTSHEHQMSYAQAVDSNTHVHDQTTRPTNQPEMSGKGKENEDGWIEVKGKKNGKRNDKENNEVPLKRTKSVKSLTPEATSDQIVDLSIKKEKLENCCYKIGNGWFVRSREIKFGKNYNQVQMNVLTIERVYGQEKKSIFLDIPWHLSGRFHIAVKKILASKKTMISDMDVTEEFVDVSNIGIYSYTSAQFQLDNQGRYSVRVKMMEYANDKSKSMWDVVCVTKMLPAKEEGKEARPFTQDIPAKFAPALEKALRDIRRINGVSFDEMRKEDIEILKEYGVYDPHDDAVEE